MTFQKNLWVLALSGAMPLVSAHAQSTADLKKEIDALKAQLQILQQKVEAVAAQPDVTPLTQQVNRLEQRLDIAGDEAEKSGFKGMKINGTIETALKYNNIDKSNDFSASAGNNGGEYGMLQITKESQDGEGIDWTLRLLPGASSLVHEASMSVPLDKENRLIGGFMPDFQGYEFAFANSNSTLGNQFITHNALYDLAGATAYTGLGMSHTLGGGAVALKWLVGNVDTASDSTGTTFSAPSYDVTTGLKTDPVPSASALGSTAKSVALAYRADWTINDTSTIGLSGLHGAMNRSFNILTVDGGYIRGDWQFNGQLTAGQMERAAANGGTARWTGLSAFMAYKIVPRLQLLARADFIDNRDNGGGTYADNGGGSGNGLGPEGLDATGSFAYDETTGVATRGANLLRYSLGTNYQVNSNTQWKTEYRLDQSTGYNFLGSDGVTYQKDKTTVSTSVVLSF
ncbi:MAG: DUF3138 family protein [Betaproteobacteria bacterium]